MKTSSRGREQYGSRSRFVVRLVVRAFRADFKNFKYIDKDWVLWWAVSDLNAGPSGCKPDALTAELTARRLIVAEPPSPGLDPRREL